MLFIRPNDCLHTQHAEDKLLKQIIKNKINRMYEF